MGRVERIARGEERRMMLNGGREDGSFIGRRWSRDEVGTRCVHGCPLKFVFYSRTSIDISNYSDDHSGQIQTQDEHKSTDPDSQKTSSVIFQNVVSAL